MIGRYLGSKPRCCLGRKVGRYSGSKKIDAILDVIKAAILEAKIDALSFFHDASHLASSLTTQCKKITLKNGAKLDANSKICCSE